jgi:hypothetical protein
MGGGVYHGGGVYFMEGGRFQWGPSFMGAVFHGAVFHGGFSMEGVGVFLGVVFTWAPFGGVFPGPSFLTVVSYGGRGFVFHGEVF